MRKRNCRLWKQLLPFVLSVAPRDVRCSLFAVQVRVRGRLALSIRYRVGQSLAVRTASIQATLIDRRAFAGIFGLRDLRANCDTEYKSLFLRTHRELLLSCVEDAHVHAAASSQQFQRISNELASRHALLIMPFVNDDEIARRLGLFQLCDGADVAADFHWTARPPRLFNEALPLNMAA